MGSENRGMEGVKPTDEPKTPGLCLVYRAALGGNCNRKSLAVLNNTLTEQSRKLILTIFVAFICFCTCVYVCMCSFMHATVDLRESVLSFYRVGLPDQTQVVRRSGKHLYPVSRLFRPGV